MLGDLQDRFFEFRHHAYVEMAWYFGMMLLINLAFGILGGVWVDKGVISTISNSSQQQTCDLINTFLIIFSTLSLVDTFLNAVLVLTLPSIMRGPKWAGCGLLTLSLFGILLLGKVITVILGAVWIMGNDGLQCATVVNKFYGHGKTYFIAVTVVLALQITVGTLYLLKCGLSDAVEEGVDQLEQEALIRQARDEARQNRNRRE